jgi:thioesterase domain-containing protein
VYGLRARDVASLPEDLPTLAARYAEALLPLDPSHMHLCGWSAGGLVAFEIANQLEQRGHAPAGLLLLDCHVVTMGKHEDIGAPAYCGAVAQELGIAIPPDAERALDEARRVPDPERTRIVIAVMEKLFGIAAEELRERLRVFVTVGRAVIRHGASASFGGPIHVVSPDPERARKSWAGKLDQAASVTVPGDHYSMMRRPDVEALGRALLEIIGAPRDTHTSWRRSE